VKGRIKEQQKVPDMKLSVSKIFIFSLVAAFLPVSGIAAASDITAVAQHIPAPLRQDLPPGTADAGLPLAVSWGRNSSGEVGDGSEIDRLTAVQANGDSVLPGHEVAAVDTGSNHTCAVADGKAYCWGDNSSGQLGDNSTQDSDAPVPVAGALAGRWVTAISAGDSHTCAVADGRAYCWGFNGSGQLGTGSTDVSLQPVAVDTSGVLGGLSVTSISASVSFTCATAQGHAFCWGRGQFGQLGTGDEKDSLSPAAVVESGPLVGGVVDAVATGWHHGCLLSSGRVFCWGTYSTVDEDGPSDYSTVPQPISVSGALKGKTVTALSAGSYTTCVLAKAAATTAGARAGNGYGNRKPYCWGAGPLGNSSPSGSHYPQPVDVTGALKDKDSHTITVGDVGSCVLAEGRGYCWGEGAQGRLGNGSTAFAATPVAVSTAGPLVSRALASLNTNRATAGISFTYPVYSDVAVADPFIDDIRWAVGTGIIRGYGGGLFKPWVPVLRKELAAYLFRYSNPGASLPECTGGTRIYGDVSAQVPLCGAIEWMAKAKIVPSTGDFNPDGELTNAFVANYLFRLQHPGTTDLSCQGSTRTFLDVSSQLYSCGNIEWLAKAGVSNAVGNYLPGNSVSRAQLSALLFALSALGDR